MRGEDRVVEVYQQLVGGVDEGDTVGERCAEGWRLLLRGQVLEVVELVDAGRAIHYYLFAWKLRLSFMWEGEMGRGGMELGVGWRMFYKGPASTCRKCCRLQGFAKIVVANLGSHHHSILYHL